MCGLLLAFGAAAGAFGCGPDYKARATVKGAVSISGKALNAGTVMFVTADGRSGVGVIDASGNYVMADAPIGEVTVLVNAPKPSGPGGGMAGMNMKGMPESLKKMNAPKAVGKPQLPDGLKKLTPPSEAEGGGGMKMADPIDPAKVVGVPDKYGNAETSGLKYTVVKGEQTYDIKLTP